MKGGGTVDEWVSGVSEWVRLVGGVVGCGGMAE